MSDALEFGHKVHATHLVVCCIDHRCTNDLVSVIPRIIKDPAGKDWDRYDLIALPGASLGPVQTAEASWGLAFWSQLAIARQLHEHIRTVVVADHLHCGAYKKLYPGYLDDMRAAHEQTTRRFAAEVKARHSDVAVERWLLVPMSESELDWTADNLDAAGESFACQQHSSDVP